MVWDILCGDWHGKLRFLLRIVGQTEITFIELYDVFLKIIHNIHINYYSLSDKGYSNLLIFTFLYPYCRMLLIFTQIIISKYQNIFFPIPQKHTQNIMFPKLPDHFPFPSSSPFLLFISSVLCNDAKFYRLDPMPFNNHLINRRTMEKRGLTATSLLKSA